MLGARTKLNLSGVSLRSATMKAVALILALAVITGCNGRAVPQVDTSTTRLENSVGRFVQYITDLNQQADGVLDNLKIPQLSRELETLITDTMGELATYRDEIQSKLAPYTSTPTGQISEDLQLLANKLQKDMTDAKERSTVYLNELKGMVEQNTDDVRGRITAYTTKLRKRLNKDTEEIRDTVATYMGEIQSRTNQNVEAMRENVEPYVQQASDSAAQKLKDISTMLESQAETIKTQLESSMKELSTSMDSKLEELTDLISPYATQVREHLENVMQKVKETAVA
ncbi:apolipoprotein Eb [Fundulus diaphanus]